MWTPLGIENLKLQPQAQPNKAGVPLAGKILSLAGLIVAGLGFYVFSKKEAGEGAAAEDTAVMPARGTVFEGENGEKLQVVKMVGRPAGVKNKSSKKKQPAPVESLET